MKTIWAGVAQSAWRLRYGLDGLAIESRRKGSFPANIPTEPVAHTASCQMGTGSLSNEKSGQDVALTTRSYTAPRFKTE